MPHICTHLATVLINSHSTFGICEQAGARYKKPLGSFVYFHTQRVVSTSALGNVWTERRTSRQTNASRFPHTRTRCVASGEGGGGGGLKAAKHIEDLWTCVRQKHKSCLKNGKRKRQRLHPSTFDKGEPPLGNVVGSQAAVRWKLSQRLLCSCNCKWEREESSAGNAER